MKRLYHYLFVGFVSLITVILAAFLLLFTDVAFSSVGTADTHLSNGNIWSVNKLRLSAELAYYNYLSSTSNEKSLTLDNTTISQQNIVDKQREAYNFLSNKDTTSTQETETVSTNVQHHNVRISKLHSRHGKRGKKSKYHFNDSNTTTLSNLSTANSTPRVVNHVRTVTEKLEYNNKIGLQLDVDRGASEKVEGSIEAVDMNETYTEEDDHYNEEYYTSKDEMIVSEAERIRRALILSQNEEFEAIDNNSHTVITGASNITQKSHGSLLHGGSYIKPELMKRSTNTQFHMPCPCVYRSINEIVTAIWMKPLLRILSSFQGNQVTLVIANDAYRDVLLNWLISALIMSHPPIDNILVVCLDTKLYNLLQSRDIPSILAPFSSVLNTKHHFRRYFELIMMMRLGFMCIINRLGYDCAMYDIDAIILKNPQPLYDKWDSMDIVGSRGELPRELWRRWGVSICIGAVFIRSNARTGQNTHTHTHTTEHHNIKTLQTALLT